MRVADHGDREDARARKSEKRRGPGAAGWATGVGTPVSAINASRGYYQMLGLFRDRPCQASDLRDAREARAQKLTVVSEQETECQIIE